MKLLLAVLPLVLLLGLLALAVKFLEAKRQLRQGTIDGDDERGWGPMPYARNDRPVLSEAEAKFLGCLEQAVAEISGGKGRVLVQVQLSRILKVDIADAAERRRWHNRIDRKSVDFAIVDSAFKVRAAVELDDASHQRQTRKDRDSFVEEACARAGVVLLRFPARASYDAGAVTQQIRNGIDGAAGAAR